jgi:hypothetical protein
MTEEAMPTDLYAPVFFTADHAAVESGKLYISGGAWNRVAYPVSPAVQTIAVAAILHVPWRAHGQSHAFLIEFEDADGQKVGGRVEGRFEAQTPPDARSGDYSIVPVAVQVGGFVFPREGITRRCLRSTGPR